MAKIAIRSSTGTYRVICESGAAGRISSLISHPGDSTGLFILSSPRVWKNCGKRVLPGFRARKKPPVVLFDDREHEKRLATVQEIARQLIRAGADREAILVAVGGGVVGDVAGFVAATYLRGVRLVHVPTTLVAQVDSAIGGKTGVNLPEGKNLVGAFYHPKVIVVDPDLLSTLPHREYRSGLYEVIKYGVIADLPLFIYLWQKMPALLRRDPAALAYVIPRCIRFKAQIVERDERESGLRQVLNFGHTFGHALEAFTGYRRFLHGEAVAWGMIAATAFALASGRLSLRDGFGIISLIGEVGPLPPLPTIPATKLHRLLAGDKKSRGGEVRWVLPRRIGKVDRDVQLDRNFVEKYLPAFPLILKEVVDRGMLAIAQPRR
jgi:3-dehydroquinate synthase